jgi:hypothetical protein
VQSWGIPQEFPRNSPGIPQEFPRNSGNRLLRFGEFAGTWICFLQEPILNAVQMVQEHPKTHSVFMGNKFL